MKIIYTLIFSLFIFGAANAEPDQGKNEWPTPPPDEECGDD